MAENVGCLLLMIVLITQSYFLKDESGLLDKVNELIKELEAKYSIQVKKIQCNN